MSHRKYFFLIYPEDTHIRVVLDSIRVIADPTQKNFSHITLKGPYSKRVDKIFKRDNANIAGKRIKIQGSGCFFNESQSTVFLSCVKTDELENIWRSKKEKTYKEFHPHLTIYDGKDREFAKNLLEIFNRYHLSFEFKIKTLTLYESKSLKNDLFNLQSAIDFGKIKELTQSNLNEKDLLDLNKTERLQLVEKLCQSLPNA